MHGEVQDGVRNHSRDWEIRLSDHSQALRVAEEEAEGRDYQQGRENPYGQ